GDNDAPRDEETALLWERAGIPKERIYFLGKKDNWWRPAGKTGPCGPDSEMFFDTGKEKCGKDCQPGCFCGKFIEIWNDVFMQYEKTAEGKYEPLKQKNIDTGMGVERTTAVISGFADDDYLTELFLPVIKKIEEISGKNYAMQENLPAGRQVKKAMRIIADHLRAATFVIADGISSSNTEQGYVLRRLIRRAIRFGKTLGIEKPFTFLISEAVIETLGDIYPEIVKNKNKIIEELRAEEERFTRTLERGLKEFNSLSEKKKEITGKDAFFLYETYGFPWELTLEMADEKGRRIDEKEFQKAFKEHQEKSREGSEKKFAGGLADHSEMVTKYHTATHLLHSALRIVLGDTVHQVGSNITAERLRFDFTAPKKLIPEEIKKVEDLVNEQIKKDLPVTIDIMNLAEAKKKGALAFFEQKYAEQVKVYTVSDFSKEVCGGPHVERTGILGSFKIIKEESCGAGKRRIYAMLS
ncbi:alanine--tRNA ligase, partial [Candidatus Shapirobacteria bacterium CG03_land_8_20_14_0_80_39_12]